MSVERRPPAPGRRSRRAAARPRARRRAPARPRHDLDARCRPARPGPGRAARRSRRRPRPGRRASAISSSIAAPATQSSSSAGTLPCGLRLSASLAGLVSRPWTNFAGDGTVSSSSRRVPAHIAGRLLGLGLEDPHADGVALVDQRRVGGHRVAGPALLDGARQRADGPGGQPGRARASGGRLGERLAHLRRAAGAAARPGPCPRRAARSRSSTTRKVIRRWAGTLVQVPGVRRHRHAGQPAQLPRQRVEQRLRRRGGDRGRAPPGRSPAPGRSCGAAPWAATGSARSPAPRAGPGTCQSKPVRGDLVEHRQRDVRRSPRRRRCPARTGRSAAASARPGARRPGSRPRSTPPALGVDQHRRGEGRAGPGRSRRARFHQVSKCRPETTSAGDPLVVEVEQRLVVDQDVAPAGPVLQLLDLVEQLPGCRGRTRGGSASRPRPARAG